MRQMGISRPQPEARSSFVLAVLASAMVFLPTDCMAQLGQVKTCKGRQVLWDKPGCGAGGGKIIYNQCKDRDWMRPHAEGVGDHCSASRCTEGHSGIASRSQATALAGECDCPLDKIGAL